MRQMNFFIERMIKFKITIYKIFCFLHPDIQIWFTNAASSRLGGRFNFLRSRYRFISTLLAEMFESDAISFEESPSLINAISRLSLSVKFENCCESLVKNSALTLDTDE